MYLRCTLVSPIAIFIEVKNVTQVSFFFSFYKLSLNKFTYGKTDSYESNPHYKRMVCTYALTCADEDCGCW